MNEDLIKSELKARGWTEPALSRELQSRLQGDRYEVCPLQVLGFRIRSYQELGEVIFGSDGKCICTKTIGCRNVDRRDGNRCTENELDRLNYEAICRRIYQSGEDC
jgi:hypothetical protein